VGLHYENLDEVTRGFSLQESALGNHYRSPRLADIVAGDAIMGPLILSNCGNSIPASRHFWIKFSEIFHFCPQFRSIKKYISFPDSDTLYAEISFSAAVSK
jgi:hypothetical protein